MNHLKRSAAMRVVLLAAGAAIMILSGCGAPPSPSGETAGVPAEGAMSLAFTNASIAKCYYCHSDQADAKYEAYGPSVHNTIAAPTLSGGLARQKCSKCHTDEGAKLYLTNTPAQLSSTITLATTANPIQCDTCHDAHGSNNLLLGAGTDVFGNVASAEYKTCTNCHEESNALHGTSSKHSWSGGVFGVGNFDAAEIIYDTHFDVNTTDGIEGYIINAANPNACRECHNVHSADLTINEQWARSGHGGFILDIKERAFLNTANTDPLVANTNALNILHGVDQYGAQTGATTPNYAADAWAHYDFKVSSRSTCQRCHTSTGFRNFADNPAIYDANKDEVPDNINVFFANSVFAGSKQKEMLYCWACHTSVDSGALRDPGMMYSQATINAPLARIMNVPDLDGSNICIACHSGRKTGTQHVKNASDITKSFSTYYPHYLPAGGILFRVIGYENGPSADYYDNYSFFTHDRIGNSIAAGGSNGPCVGCHMRSGEGHRMEAVTLDNNGWINGIPAYEETCSECHGLESSLVGLLNSQRTGFELSLEGIENTLMGKGIFYNSVAGRPYFFGDIANITAYTTWADKDTLGVAFNLFTLDHEPGAYVHNSRYTKRLLYDAFDYLDDSALNKSVTAVDVPDLDAYQFLGSGTRP